MKPVNVATVARACAVLLSIGCVKPTPVGESSPGGQGATAYGLGDAGIGGTGGGSSRTDDAYAVVINLDVLPPWWGSADAPQIPEVSATPTSDSNCGNLSKRTTRQPVDVLLVLDRSGSMDFSITQDCYCSSKAVKYGSVCSDTTNCTTRWDAVKPAVRTTLSSSSYVNWGLKFFPSAGANTSCTENSTMEVPFSPTSATDVQTQVDNVTYEYSTPTAAAIDAAAAYLKTLNDGNQKFILLATDGEPNCGGNPPNVNRDDLNGATNAAAAAYAAGYQVYVIGIGPNLDNLTQLAKNGGTTDFYKVSSPQDLASALSSISKLVGSCSFNSDQAPQDVNNVAVYVNGQKVDKDSNNGWTFGASSQEIILTGDHCTQMSSGDQADVQILFGCQGQSYFRQPSTDLPDGCCALLAWVVRAPEWARSSLWLPSWQRQRAHHSLMGSLAFLS
ncbi:MAG TPA: VWA domain-containing protein [Polyangia bacterium]